MRDRLIELLNKQSCPSPLLCDKNCKYAHLESCYAERVTDHLLENGVIVPPVKVGQTVFRLVRLHGYGETRIVEGKVFEIAITHEYDKTKYRFYFWEEGATSKHINRYSIWCDFEEAGKSVFLSREEAEAKMKGGEGK